MVRQQGSELQETGLACSWGLRPAGVRRAHQRLTRLPELPSRAGLHSGSWSTSPPCLPLSLHTQALMEICFFISQALI